jgi:SAM-dependent methyltransferase
MKDYGHREMSRQLTRQRGWLLEHWRYLLDRHILPELHSRRPKALDVGCGPGLVMDSLSDVLDVHGLDHDPEMIDLRRRSSLPCILGRAEEIPFHDDAFDLAYCSFLLVWVEDPGAVLDEMLRVSNDWIVCLAEPDYAARVDCPPELGELTSMIIDGTRRAGGDPYMGRRLRSLFSERGMDAEIGVHPGVWSLQRLREESEAEWTWARGMVGDGEEVRLERLRGTWDRALGEGTLFQYNPIFYALARKPK